MEHVTVTLPAKQWNDLIHFVTGDLHCMAHNDPIKKATQKTVDAITQFVVLQTAPAQKFPKYLKVGDLVIRLDYTQQGVATYYRDAGHWNADVVFENGAYLEIDQRGKTVRRIRRWIPATRKEWKESNAGYV